MMMNGMTPGMMWGMGLVWLLAVIVLILAAAALVKYLRSTSNGFASVKNSWLTGRRTVSAPICPT